MAEPDSCSQSREFCLIGYDDDSPICCQVLHHGSEKHVSSVMVLLGDPTPELDLKPTPSGSKVDFWGRVDTLSRLIDARANF